MSSGSSATRWQAPAKLNLFLHVVGRRADGYHLIQSAMQLIDLVDDVTIELRDDGRIERTSALAGVAEDDDLVVRAARLLQTASATTRGASIGVIKRTPMGGGLGGGSSDAATTLLALNRLWRVGLSRERLMALGLSLGADVPFFIGGGGDAFVEGIGERLSPVGLPPAHYAVVHPGVAVPTAAIFTASELTRDTEIIRISDFAKNASHVLGAASVGGSAVDGGVFRNDLEPVAAARFGAVRQALDWLAGTHRGAIGTARMSGSGACVFRCFGSATDAERCIARLRIEMPQGWSGWSVASLATHPHRDCAAGDAAEESGSS